jgi:hypothetical protein
MPKDIHDIAGIAVNPLAIAFSARQLSFVLMKTAIPERYFVQQLSADKQVHRNVDDVARDKQRMEGLRTGFDIGKEFL